MKSFVVTAIGLLTGVSVATAVKPGQKLSYNQRRVWESIQQKYKGAVETRAQSAIESSFKTAISSKLDIVQKLERMKAEFEGNVRRLEPLSDHQASGAWDMHSSAAPEAFGKGVGTLTILEKTDSNLEQTSNYEFTAGSSETPVLHKRRIEKKVGPFSMTATANRKVGSVVSMQVENDIVGLRLENIKQALNAREKAGVAEAEKMRVAGDPNERQAVWHDPNELRVAWYMLEALEKDLKKTDQERIRETFSATDVANHLEVPVGYAEQLLWRGAAVLRGAITKTHRGDH